MSQYLLGIGSIFFVTFCCLFLLPFTGYWTVALILLFVVTGLALFVGRGPVLISAGLSACLWNFLFIPPRFTFYIDKIEDGMMFIVYFFIATILGSLTNRLRTKESAIRLRESRIVSLYNFSQLLARSHTMKDIVKATVSFIDESLDAKCCIILKDEKENLSSEIQVDSNLTLSEKEKAVALWAFKNKKPAGRFTDTLPLSEGYYIPLLTDGNAIGIIGLVIKDNVKLTLDKEALLQTFTSQIAIAIERIHLGKMKQRTLMLEESERLYKILLNSVSHEFRTPLTAIRGSVNLLLDDKSSKEINNSLLIEIHTAYEKLNRLVDNLLDMSRLESGMIKLNIEWHDIQDLISVVLKKLENELRGKEVKLEISDSLPLVRIDFILMEQVISNLLYNAIIHTPSDTKIIIRITIPRTDLTIMIEDNGPGFIGIDTERIFDKFYQGKINKSGIGLGLSICKGLVEIHGGTIVAENIPEGGARFIIRLPVITFPYPMDSELEK
jgi:two-component system sensor histidine kinase KdpD